MFNSNARGRESGASALSPSGNGKRGLFSVIGPDVVITGDVSATADLHVEGRIDGDVRCGNLVQGPESRIKGAVTADAARLAGTIEGSVAARELTVERAARVSGDVEYDTITIETGATIDGRLKRVGGDAPAGGPAAAADA